MNMRWLIGALILVSTLAVVHAYATTHFSYWYYPWLDIPVHILGGASIAVLIIAISGVYKSSVFWGTLLLVALGWELFEYIFAISTGQPNYWFDTLHDILNDLIGAGIVYVVARVSVWR
jgi:hypothetical protein